MHHSLITNSIYLHRFLHYKQASYALHDVDRVDKSKYHEHNEGNYNH